MRRGIARAIALAGLVLPAVLLSGQEHSHGSDDAPRPARSESREPLPPLSRLLAASDDAVRAIKRAAADDEPRAIAASVQAYDAAVKAVERFVEESPPDRIARDLPRVERALERQRALLEEVAERLPSGPREALGSATDASTRVLDAAAAAREVGGDTQASGHQARQRRHGCGRR